MMGNKQKLSLAIIASVFLLGINFLPPPICYSVDFGGGTGEPNDPYKIATAEQLISIGNDPNLLDKHFVMIADIDLSGMIWTAPVIPSFSGTFDGNGFAVKHLNAIGVGPQGLFEFIEKGAQVKHLGVVDADVTGTTFTGGLAGRNSGTILHCYSTGKVVGPATGGGITGYNEGDILCSHSSADVTGYSYIGGIVGFNERGTLSGCYSSGRILGTDSAGGLVGRNSGRIASSYSVGEVLGSSRIGGLVGINEGLISSCYANGDVTGTNNVGGLVGDNNGGISMCYAAVHVEEVLEPVSALDVGGLVGANDESAAVYDSYYLAAIDHGGPDNNWGTPLTIDQMKDRTHFAGWDFWGTDTDGISDVWFMPVDGMPVLSWQTDATGLQAIPDVAGLSLVQAQQTLEDAGFKVGTIAYDYDRAVPDDHALNTYPREYAPEGASVTMTLSGGLYNWVDNPGTGTFGDPYQINTAGQLDSLAEHSDLWDKHFVLTDDIDLFGRVYDQAIIAPDINDQADRFQGTPFWGSLDGAGHVISNLYIQNRDPYQEYLGLIGQISAGGRMTQVEGTIANLHLRNVSIIGGDRSYYVGVLAGYSDGTIMNCSATGFLRAGCTSVGSLVGSDHGDVIDSHADVAVVKHNCHAVR